MKLRFLGKQSTPTNSPTLYATDQESFVVQGWIVQNRDVPRALAVADDETIVEIPPALLDFLAQDGLDGVVSEPAPPIVGLTGAGNYIVRGKRVVDDEALAQMTIPDHESCVEVPRSVMASLLVGG